MKGRKQKKKKKKRDLLPLGTSFDSFGPISINNDIVVIMTHLYSISEAVSLYKKTRRQKRKFVSETERQTI